MASSQLQIGPSFGWVLRDRNRRHNDDVVFQKNLKALLRTASPESPAISDENSQNRAESGNKLIRHNKSRIGSPEKPRIRNRKKFPDSSKPSTSTLRSEKSKRNDNLGGASSLVQIWEARLKRSNGGNSPIHDQSIETVQEIHLLAPSTDGESESENESKIPDPTVEIKSGTPSSVSDSGWGQVAETIRRLKLTTGDNGGAVDMPIVKTTSPGKSSFPGLRGRQALSDLLTAFERDRHRELESLLESKTVSVFPQRGRLKSMLRLRSLERCLAIQDRHRSNTKDESNRFEFGSTVLNLREKIRENTANAADEAEQRKCQQSTESLQSKEIIILLETSSTERQSPRDRKIEEVILNKNDTESKMSYLQLQEEAIVAETLKIKSDKTNVMHQEPHILLENEEANKVKSGMQGTQETYFLEQQETHFLEPQETLFLNGWEEQEEYEYDQSYNGELSYDWFSEISRPRTYWEDLRKSRYLEVMNTRSDKDDICRLLERRTVSDFLQSGLREKIDKLIMSRVQTHPIQLIEEAVNEEEKCDIVEEEDDDLSQTSSHIFASSPVGSWSSHANGVTSKSDLIPLHNLHSNEMEIIGELRSQILQLQLEMSELRDSVKTCLNVNASLQKSVHQGNPLKRKCCVCNETQVETLLYRCGHMCTCLRCANELQWNEGKCPICHAKILDVVRVFVDSTT